eukprot:gene17574-20926_t
MAAAVRSPKVAWYGQDANRTKPSHFCSPSNDLESALARRDMRSNGSSSSSDDEILVNAMFEETAVHRFGSNMSTEIEIAELHDDESVTVARGLSGQDVSNLLGNADLEATIPGAVEPENADAGTVPADEAANTVSWNEVAHMLQHMKPQEVIKLIQQKTAHMAEDAHLMELLNDNLERIGSFSSALF